MADTLKFRGLSTVQVTGNVATREIVLDTELNQIAFGGDGTVYRFYNTTQIDAMIASLAGYDDTDGDELDDLTDVDIATQNLVYGDVLSWDGTSWVNSGVDISRSVLDNLGDVNITTPVEVGDYIVWNGLSWVNYEAPSVRNLSDTLLTDPLLSNQSLVWNGTNWTDSYVPLGDAADVTLSGNATNQSLVWNGSQWVNLYVPLGDAADVTLSSNAVNQSLVWDGSQWVNSYLTISDATDVDTSGATTGQRLEYNGTNWVAVPNDADTLDGLDSLQFLRSDDNDTFTGTVTGNIMLLGGSQIQNSGAALQVNGFMRTGSIYLHEGGNTPTTSSLALGNTSGTLKWDGNTVWHAGNDGAGSGLDADTLDGLGSLQFLRSDESDTMAGTLTATAFSGDGSSLTSLNASNINDGVIGDAYLPNTISSNITGNAATADLADGFSASANGANAAFPIVVVNGTNPLTSQGGATINVGTGKITAVKFEGDGSKVTNLDYNNISNPPAASITNLGVSRTVSSVTVTCSTGDNATINEATSSNAGVMTTTQHDKLDGIEDGAQVNVDTNLSNSTGGGSVTIQSSTGSNTTISAATTTDAGVMSSTMKTKLDGIADNATNVTNNNQITNGAGYITSSDSITGNAATADVADKLEIIGSGNTTNTRYPILASTTGGQSSPIVDGGLSYKPSTDTLTAGVFSGSGASLTSIPAGQLTGTIDDARLPASISSDITGTADKVNCVAITSDQETYPILAPGPTGTRIPSTHTGLKYNVNNSTLTATTFSGSLSGTASTATSVTITGIGTNADYRVVLGSGTGNDKDLYSDGGLVYNPSTNVLTAGTFSGSMAYSNLTGTPTIYGEPAIFRSGGNPTLASGVTGAEVRSLIGAGTSSFSGSYNDLSNKPTIYGEPAIYRSGGTPTLAGGITAGEIRTLINASNFSGSYNDLSNKPTIPTNNNQLTNGAGYLSSLPADQRTTGTSYNGSTTDSTNITAANNILLTPGTSKSIYFRGQNGSGSYRFAKASQTAIEGFLSFQSLTADRTFTFPNTTGTVALTSSDITGNAASATIASTISVNNNGANTQYPVLVHNNGIPLTSQAGVTINVGSGKLFAVKFQGDGSNLTSLKANQLTGTIDAARLPATINSDTTGNAATATTAGSCTTATTAASCTGDSTGVSAGSATADIESNSNLRFRSSNSSGASGAYRFGKPGQLSREGLLSFTALGSDRTFTFPNTTGTVDVTASSDRRLKKDIADITSQDALNFVNNVEPVTFCWRNGEGSGMDHCHDHSAGYIAQQVSAAGYPYMLDTTPMVEDDEEKGNYYTHDRTEVDAETGVSNPDNAYYTMKYELATPFLHKALADALTKIDELQARLDAAGL